MRCASDSPGRDPGSAQLWRSGPSGQAYADRGGGSGKRGAAVLTGRDSDTCRIARPARAMSGAASARPRRAQAPQSPCALFWRPVQHTCCAGAISAAVTGAACACAAGPEPCKPIGKLIASKMASTNDNSPRISRAPCRAARRPCGTWSTGARDRRTGLQPGSACHAAMPGSFFGHACLYFT